MPRLVIEVVDAGLSAWQDGELLAGPSPGVALLDPAGLVLGSEAVAQQRLRPVQAFDRFWSELDADTLPRAVTGAQTRADLAFLHLQRFVQALPPREDREVVLAVPGSLRPRQLGLLAGIAAAAGLQTVGFIDLAVAAAATVPAHPRVLHLDLHLHQAVLTELAGRQSLRRGRVELAPRVGLRSLHESWARWVAGSMVGRTRFDPLHHAASEQSLMDRLPEWLELLEQREEVEAAIDSPHGRLAVPFTREDALLAAEAFYAQLVELVRGQLQGEPVTVLLGHRTRSVPGLVERLAALPGVEARRLEPGAVARGVAQWPGMGEGGLLIALPRSVPLPSERLSETVPARAPTHLLHAGQAHRLQEGELCVGLDPAGDRQLRLAGRPTGVSRQHCRLVASAGRVELLDDSRYGTWVNGRRVQGSVLLSPGDKLRVGTPGVILDLIEVE
ncbi:MAG: FHA domain-containing protein [Steroidobacteraceae bacterium]